ncbi:excisionase [Pseudonocardia sp. DSM 110487]|uniref:citrate/2-methylcitrate synthase n=1 Tax=Pseudonocardia sp. DSM 110487 TaxID=2865833 RepID=UPI001C6A6FD2|nr:citrate/2-methylcitrate synthase [Pseudonocardia sp. DSM 110487]QYN33288.1 excisionase [Pseudonocardia sp. DSM 110487]
MEEIDAAEAARRLGVKPATLYAYVSRGVLRRRPGSDGRRSMFDAAEVALLARRGRPRRAAETELVVESALTALVGDRPYYRGRDALALAGTARYEQVATWLWTGDPDAFTATASEWRVASEALAAVRDAQRGLPGDLLPLDRMPVIVTVLAGLDPLRFHLEPPAVVAAGQTIVAGLVEGLPVPEEGSPLDGSVAERLWSRLTPRPPDGLLDVLEATLVLLADHELAASTLAARVAASVRADPYAVVLAGLGVLSGPLHGGASLAAERMFADVRGPSDAARVIGERLRRGDRIPGLGHRVYTGADGRGVRLMELLRAAVPGHEQLAAAEAVIAEAGRRRLPAPNVDLAVACLARVAGMVPGAGAAIAAVARTAGWLAHGMEEYARGRMLRPRAVYTGPPPGS